MSTEPPLPWLSHRLAAAPIAFTNVAEAAARIKAVRREDVCASRATRVAPIAITDIESNPAQ